MKREERTELTRQKILAAAIREFGTRGYAGASLNSICESGIPKGLLYHNYKNKDAVYLACVGQCFRNLTEHLRAAGVGSDLEKYMLARMEFFREHDLEAHIFFDAVLQPPEALRGDILALRGEFDALSRELFQQTIHCVTLRPGITEEDAMAYFAIVQDMFNSYFSSPACRQPPPLGKNEHSRGQSAQAV